MANELVFKSGSSCSRICELRILSQVNKNLNLIQVSMIQIMLTKFPFDGSQDTLEPAVVIFRTLSDNWIQHRSLNTRT